MELSPTSLDRSEAGPSTEMVEKRHSGSSEMTAGDTDRGRQEKGFKTTDSRTTNSRTVKNDHRKARASRRKRQSPNSSCLLETPQQRPSKLQESFAGDNNKSIETTESEYNEKSRIIRQALQSLPVSLREPNPEQSSHASQPVKQSSSSLNLPPTCSFEFDSHDVSGRDHVHVSKATRTKRLRSRVQAGKKFSSKKKKLDAKKLQLEQDDKDAALSGSKDESEEELYHDSAAVVQPSLQRIRKREKPYECGVCFRMFGCKSHVVEHMRTHTGEKPFECSVCHKRFSQKSNIYQHMNTHTMERPFSCSDCGKSFMYRGSLYKHKRLHTGERPYSCGMCQKKFTHGSQLFEHMRTHTNEKPFSCGVCKRAFAHSGTMHRHQRNHFKGKNLLKFGNINIDEVEGSVEVEVLRDTKPNTLMSCTKITKNGVQVVEAEEVGSISDINHNYESYTPEMLDQEIRRLLKVKVASPKPEKNSTEKDSAVPEHDHSVSAADATVAKPKDAFATSISEGIDDTWVLAASVRLDRKLDQSSVDTIVLKSGEVVPNFFSPSKHGQILTPGINLAANLLHNNSFGKSSAEETVADQAKISPKTSSSKRKRRNCGTEKGSSCSNNEEATAEEGTVKKVKRIRIETEDKKIFACNLCGRSFCHRRSVKRHKQAHHPEALADNTVLVKDATATGAVQDSNNNIGSINSEGNNYPLSADGIQGTGKAESGNINSLLHSLSHDKSPVKSGQSLDPQGRLGKFRDDSSSKGQSLPVSIRLGVTSLKGSILTASASDDSPSQYLVLGLNDHQVLVNPSAMLRDPSGTIKKALSQIHDLFNKPVNSCGAFSETKKSSGFVAADLSQAGVDVNEEYDGADTVRKLEKILAAKVSRVQSQSISEMRGTIIDALVKSPNNRLLKGLGDEALRENIGQEESDPSAAQSKPDDGQVRLLMNLLSARAKSNDISNVLPLVDVDVERPTGGEKQGPKAAHSKENISNVADIFTIVSPVSEVDASTSSNSLLITRRLNSHKQEKALPRQAEDIAVTVSSSPKLMKHCIKTEKIDSEENEFFHNVDGHTSGEPSSPSETSQEESEESYSSGQVESESETSAGQSVRRGSEARSQAISFISYAGQSFRVKEEPIDDY